MFLPVCTWQETSSQKGTVLWVWKDQWGWHQPRQIIEPLPWSQQSRWHDLRQTILTQVATPLIIDRSAQTVNWTCSWRLHQTNYAVKHQMIQWRDCHPKGTHITCIVHKLQFEDASWGRIVQKASSSFNQRRFTRIAFRRIYNYSVYWKYPSFLPLKPIWPNVSTMKRPKCHVTNHNLHGGYSLALILQNHVTLF